MSLFFSEKLRPQNWQKAHVRSTTESLRHRSFGFCYATNDHVCMYVCMFI